MFREPTCYTTFAVSGGFTTSPQQVETHDLGGETFIHIRQYDEWLSWMICKKSRRRKPLKRCTLWSTINDRLEEPTGEEEPDMLGDLMADLVDLEAPQKKRKSARHKNVVPSPSCGSSTTRIGKIATMSAIKVFVPRGSTSCQNRVFAQRRIGWFVRRIAMELAVTEVEPGTGVEWQEGGSCWYCSWLQGDGWKELKKVVRN